MRAATITARPNVSPARSCSGPDYARAWLNQAGALLDAAPARSRRKQRAPRDPARAALGRRALRARQHPGRSRQARCGRQLRTATPCATRRPTRAITISSRSRSTSRAISPARTRLRTCAAARGRISGRHCRNWCFCKRRLCDWHDLAPLSQQLLDGVERGAAGITPFSLLVEESTPAQQLACARRFAELKQAQVAPLRNASRCPSSTHVRTDRSASVSFRRDFANIRPRC